MMSKPTYAGLSPECAAKHREAAQYWSNQIKRNAERGGGIPIGAPNCPALSFKIYGKYMLLKMRNGDCFLCRPNPEKYGSWQRDRLLAPSTVAQYEAKLRADMSLTMNSVGGYDGSKP